MKLHQAQYLTNLLEKFGMQDCKPVATPVDQSTKLLPSEGEPVNKEEYQALIGGLTYAVTATRPDLAHALGTVNQFCSNPGEEHWKAAKRRNRFGGGVGFYIRNSINFQVRSDLTIDDIEFLTIEINKDKIKPFLISTWYRPPNSSIDLFNKFENILRLIVIEEKESIIVGDLNYDLFNKSQEDYITEKLNFIINLY